jgi:hypothetical protein
VFSAPRLLTGPESLLLAGMAAIAGAVLAARFGRWSSSRARSAGAIAAALVASTLVVAPVTAWAMISDIRASHRLSARQAERIGPEANDVDTSLIDQVRELIPRDATYAVTFSDRLDPDRASVFRVWSLSALLPRMAVTELPSADWIVSWGVAPADLNLAVTDVHTIDPRRQSDPPVYVARIVG